MFQMDEQELVQQAILQSLLYAENQKSSPQDLQLNRDKLAQEREQFYQETIYKMPAIDIYQLFQFTSAHDNLTSKQARFIHGLQIKKQTKEVNFLMANQGGKSWLRHQHIGMPLKIYCDINYPHDISFSLNPNPDQKIANGQFPKTQVKWFSIDQFYKRQVLAKTKFGEILFKADYIMKQLNLGINQKGQKFDYPEDLLPLFHVDYAKQKDQNQSICRYFLKVNDKHKIISLSEDKQFFNLQFSNPVIQVEARNMVIKDGKLIDMPNQDEQSKCYILAKKFSENYDLIAYHYPIFNDLKGAIIAIAFGKWLKTQNVKICKDFINDICKDQIIINYEKTIPFITGQFEFQQKESLKGHVFMDKNGQFLMGNQQTILNGEEYLIQVPYDMDFLAKTWVFSVTGGFDGNLPNNLFLMNQVSSTQNNIRSLLGQQKNNILSSINASFKNAFSASNTINLKQKDLIQKQKIDMISQFQISSPKLYEKNYSKPNYPGNGKPGDQSGVTVGIGCDLGHMDKKNFQTLFKHKISSNQYKTLEGALGKRGPQAKKYLQQNKNSFNKVQISLSKAKQIFKEHLKEYQTLTQKNFPGVKQKYPHTYNSLVSLVYNRGSSLKGDTRRQMKEIHEVVTGKRKLGPNESIPTYVANKIRQMKRLWKNKNLSGLIKRRQVQAKNCENDLS